MAKAFVDTTVLTDALLKTGAPKDAAVRALSQYSETLLPVYAIKEFKAGPLHYFCWMHNKFALTNSFVEGLEWLRRMSMTPKKYTTATAIEALKTAASSMGTSLTPELLEKYGENHDQVMCDRYRLAIKDKVFRAWRNRRNITTEVVIELPCYPEAPPTVKRGLIETKPTKCGRGIECSMAAALKDKPDDLRKLMDAVSKQPDSREKTRRYQALRFLIRTPNLSLIEENCRALGDAVFAFFAPADSCILTTNTRDHKPLAEALGKTAKTP